jgi:hypothetical protein
MFNVSAPYGRRLGLLLLAGSLMAGEACSGKSSSANPSGPSTTSTSSNNPPTTPPVTTPPVSSATCRTYPTAASVTTVSGGTTTNALLVGSFNTASNTSTITTLFVNGGQCTSSVFTYRSTADFVDEVRVIPGVSLQTTTTTTNTSACGSGTSNVSYTYDAQRRLTSFTTNALGVSSTATYTAWDSSGRPTTGSFPGTTIANVYNDATRTWVQTQTIASGAASTTTTTFDANGAQLSIVNVSGGNTTTTTFTNTTTAQVCK